MSIVEKDDVIVLVVVEENVSVDCPNIQQRVDGLRFERPMIPESSSL